MQKRHWMGGEGAPSPGSESGHTHWTNATSKHSPWTSCIDTTWEHARNANPRTSPSPTPSETRGGVAAICIFTSLSGASDTSWHWRTASPRTRGSSRLCCTESTALTLPLAGEDCHESKCSSTVLPPAEPSPSIFKSWTQAYRMPAAAAAKWLHSCLTLCDPVDGSAPGFPVPGILQARTLEWVAISFSNAWKWKVKVKSLSRPHGLQPTRLLHLWDIPGKSTGVGCHCLLHRMPRGVHIIRAWGLACSEAATPARFHRNKSLLAALFLCWVHQSILSHFPTFLSVCQGFLNSYGAPAVSLFCCSRSSTVSVKKKNLGYLY